MSFASLARMLEHIPAPCPGMHAHENSASLAANALQLGSFAVSPRLAGDRSLSLAACLRDPAGSACQARRLAGVSFDFRGGVSRRFTHLGEPLAVVSLLADRRTNPALFVGDREICCDSHSPVRHQVPPVLLRFVRAPGVRCRADSPNTSGRGQGSGCHDVFRDLPAAGRTGIARKSVVRKEAQALLPLGGVRRLRDPGFSRLLHGRNPQDG